MPAPVGVASLLLLSDVEVKEAIENEDYERAAQIRDELSKRN